MNCLTCRHRLATIEDEKEFVLYCEAQRFRPVYRHEHRPFVLEPPDWCPQQRFINGTIGTLQPPMEVGNGQL